MDMDMVDMDVVDMYVVEMDMDMVDMDIVDMDVVDVDVVEMDVVDMDMYMDLVDAMSMVFEHFLPVANGLIIFAKLIIFISPIDLIYLIGYLVTYNWI